MGGGEELKFREIWNILDLRIVKTKIWSEQLVDKYQIVHYHNKVPLIPVAH